MEGEPLREKINSVLKDKMGQFPQMKEEQFDNWLDDFFEAREKVNQLEKHKVIVYRSQLEKLIDKLGK